MLFSRKKRESAEQRPAEPKTPDLEVTSRPPVQTAALSLDDAQKRSIADKHVAAAFGEIVLLLLRSPRNNYSVTDLGWLVAPAVGHGQFALAEARSEETGAIRPVGAVLWAMVSDDVDKRLSDMTAPLRIQPNEWRSGDIPWIVLATGGRKVIEGLIQQLSKTVFKGKPPKTRIRGKDGKISVGHIEVKVAGVSEVRADNAAELVSRVRSRWRDAGSAVN
jgi:hemolysin-activating ACP:hemolysin acyltransferase